MFRAFSILVVVLLCVLCRGFEDRYTAGAQSKYRSVVDNIEQIPLILGDWHGENLEPDQKQLQKAELTAALSRRYIEAGTGKTITIFLAWGPSEAVRGHTPNECYASAGYDLVTELERARIAVEAEENPAEFMHGDFSKSVAGISDRLQIYWSWSGDGDWIAPDRSLRDRIQHRAFYTNVAGPLFKLYVIEHLSQRAKPAQEAIPCEDFIRQLLPELRKHLFPAN
jgi:Protein of unknown function (DUF3485)